LGSPNKIRVAGSFAPLGTIHQQKAHKASEEINTRGVQDVLKIHDAA
jgi:hypothetical protein